MNFHNIFIIRMLKITSKITQHSKLQISLIFIKRIYNIKNYTPKISTKHKKTNMPTLMKLNFHHIDYSS